MSAVIREPAVTVDPGREVRRQVVVRNTGAVVDQYLLTVRGEAGQWSRIQPDTINLLPNEETYAELVFAPPRSHEVLAGEYPYAVQVVSREDEAGSAVHEGSVTVTGFTSIDAQLVPKTAKARRKGRTILAVDNLGNYRLGVSVLGYDEDDLLVFGFRPKGISAEPGTATFVKVKPQPRKYFWKGLDRHIPYQLDVRPEDGQPLVVDGTLVQRPLLPRKTLFILPALLALLLLAAVLIATLRQLNPTSEAGHSPVVATPSISASTTIAATTTVTSSSTTAPPSSSSAVVGAGGGTAGGSGSGGGSGNGTGTESASDDISIDADASPGVAGTYQVFGYVVPAGQAISITSVQLKDSESDQGTVEVRTPDGVVALSRDLASLGEFDYRFGSPLVVEPGEQITLAVDCHNATNACIPTGTFAEGPIG